MFETLLGGVFGTSWTRKIVEWPPRTIVNVIFVENDLVVISVGIT